MHACNIFHTPESETWLFSMVRIYLKIAYGVLDSNFRILYIVKELCLPMFISLLLILHTNVQNCHYGMHFQSVIKNTYFEVIYNMFDVTYIVVSHIHYSRLRIVYVHLYTHYHDNELIWGNYLHILCYLPA